jgi:hypothetical protein
MFVGALLLSPFPKLALYQKHELDTISYYVDSNKCHAIAVRLPIVVWNRTKTHT